MKEYCRIYAEINLDNICDNIKEARKNIQKDTKIMAIIKADAYGHGAVPVAKVLNPLVDAYGIAIAEEGVELRRAGITKPILILGYTPEKMYDMILQYDLMPTVCDYIMAEKLSAKAMEYNKIVKVHMKLDTGMSRIGFMPEEESVKTIVEISKLPNLELDGIFSHFAKADEKDKTFSKEQLRKFRIITDAIEQAGVKIPTKHISNSAGIMELPEANLDMVRSGIATYGLYPSEEVQKEKLPLKAAMSIYAYITMVKELEAGVPVGYGGTYVTTKKTRVATIPAGYGDGYPRALSNQGRVLVHGQYAPIIGRVCMDQFMVDVTHIDDVKTGDRAVLVGKEGDKEITLEEIGNIYTSGDYFDIFKSSDLMITDCCSFLGEYLPSEKPLIRLKNPKAMKLNAFGERLTKEYYTSHNNDELKKLFNEIVINKNDYKKANRLKIANELMFYKESSGMNICKYLEGIFRPTR